MVWCLSCWRSSTNTSSAIISSSLTDDVEGIPLSKKIIYIHLIFFKNIRYHAFVTQRFPWMIFSTVHMFHGHLHVNSELFVEVHESMHYTMIPNQLEVNDSFKIRKTLEWRYESKQLCGCDQFLKISCKFSNTDYLSYKTASPFNSGWCWPN
jgi:hypothetical protein